MSITIVIVSAKMEKNKLPKTLKELIKQKKLTYGQMSQEVGCSVSTISQYVGGLKTPGFDKAIAMSRVLGVSLKVLALSLGLDVSDVPDDGEKDEFADPW